MKFDIGTVTKIPRETPVVKIGQNYPVCTLREDLITFYCWRRHKFVIKALLCNTESYIVDSDM
jgi:hypothetical protein